MKINTIKYFIIDALKSLKRNKTVSIASMATVSATLFILGIFILIVVNVNAGVKGLGSSLEVKISLKEDYTISDKANIERTLKEVKGIAEIKFDTKLDSLEKVRKQFGEDGKELIKGIEKKNPFPNVFLVRVDNPEVISEVVKVATGLSGVDKIKDVRKIVDQIIKITNILKIIGLVLFLILISVSLFLIGNTIKLTVYSRRKEIGIMKYVGATDWFIRWPFIIEGMMLGVSGAIISTVILYYSYLVVFSKITNVSLGFLGFTLISPYFILGTILWQFILAGLFIGATGSIIALRKFLIV